MLGLPSTVDEAMALVRTELDLVGRDVELPELRRAVRHYIENHGKLVRPMMALLTAYVIKEDLPLKRELVYGATSIELMHIVSLLQDDIVDGHMYRRGQLTPRMSHGDKLAMLASDFLIAEAVRYSALTHSLDVVLFLSDVARKLALGEAMDVTRVEDEEWYMKAIELKTASLIEASVVLPTFFVDVDAGTVGWLRKLGQSLGKLYQLRDDYSDALGAPEGHDLTEGELRSSKWALRAERAAVLAVATDIEEALGALYTAFGERAGHLRDLCNVLLRDIPNLSV